MVAYYYHGYTLAGPDNSGEDWYMWESWEGWAYICIACTRFLFLFAKTGAPGLGDAAVVGFAASSSWSFARSAYMSPCMIGSTIVGEGSLKCLKSMLRFLDRLPQKPKSRTYMLCIKRESRGSFHRAGRSRHPTTSSPLCLVCVARETALRWTFYSELRVYRLCVLARYVEFEDQFSEKHGGRAREERSAAD